jgi:hypothetical protein
MHSHRRDKDKEVTVNAIFVHGVIEHDEKNYDEGLSNSIQRQREACHEFDL